VVFVGYGITGQGRDDYKGVNVKGKIVAYFGGAPENFPGEVAAHFSNPASKSEIAARHGAVATITLESPRTAKQRPFSFYANAVSRARFTWGNPNGTGHIAAPGTPSAGTVSLVGAEKLFAGAKQKWADIAKAAEADNAVFKAEALPVTVTVAAKTALTPVQSYNVAGMIPGSDPTLSKEIVVLSAHLDHIGVGRPDKTGDKINNGALDDAVGIASLIEEAKRFKTAGTKPRRSVLFLAVTAEEKGLIGSDYFANNPTVPLSSIVADVNLDMPILTYNFIDLVAFGADRSTLGKLVEQAAAAEGVKLVPDPTPEEASFVRSDHYSFVKAGIPAVSLDIGPGGEGAAASKEFLDKHYHQPSDEVGLIDWKQGLRFVGLNYAIARAVADADDKPVWNKGDFFGTLYKGPMAK
jgi:hypothetical protein